MDDFYKDFHKIFHQYIKFPKKKFRNFIKKINGNNFLSVGSGNAIFEFMIKMFYEENHKNINITCVDPDPTSYGGKYLNGQVFIEPSFNLFEDIEDFEPYDSLILVAPHPTEGIYDFEAIKKKKWNQIILVVERSGSAGTQPLLHYLNYLDKTNFLYDGTAEKYKDSYKEILYDYGIKYKIRKISYDGELIYEWIILEYNYKNKVMLDCFDEDDCNYN